MLSSIATIIQVVLAPPPPLTSSSLLFLKNGMTWRIFCLCDSWLASLN